jgi:hypothetical protein
VPTGWGPRLHRRLVAGDPADGSEGDDDKSSETFALLLVGLTGAVGLAFVYMVGTLFVNPGRRKRSV